MQGAGSTTTAAAGLEIDFFSNEVRAGNNASTDQAQEPRAALVIINPSHCSSTETLWKHLMLCNDPDCKITQCTYVSFIFTHFYGECKILSCPVCKPAEAGIENINNKRELEIEICDNKQQEQLGEQKMLNILQKPPNSMVISNMISRSIGEMMKDRHADPSLSDAISLKTIYPTDKVDEKKEKVANAKKLTSDNVDQNIYAMIDANHIFSEALIEEQRQKITQLQLALLPPHTADNEKDCDSIGCKTQKDMQVDMNADSSGANTNARPSSQFDVFRSLTNASIPNDSYDEQDISANKGDSFRSLIDVLRKNDNHYDNNLDFSQQHSFEDDATIGSFHLAPNELSPSLSTASGSHAKKKMKTVNGQIMGDQPIPSGGLLSGVSFQK